MSKLLTSLLTAQYLLIICSISACCHPDRVRPDPAPGPDPWTPVVDWYADRSPDSTSCPPEAMIGSLVAGAMDLEYGWAACRLRLTEAQGIAGIDAGVAAGQLAHERVRADQYRVQRWLWGAVGAALGSLAAGLLVGLAR